MKIIGLLLLVLGVIGIVLTVMDPVLFGYGGLIAGAAAILTGIVFVAGTAIKTYAACERRNHNGCC